MRFRPAVWFYLIPCLLFCPDPDSWAQSDRPRLCDEGRPAQSLFRHLPSDTLNALPHSGYSRRLQKLFAQVKASSKDPIRFTQLPPEATDISMTASITQERAIALRVGMDRKLEENAIAHELFHLILQDEGFAAIIQVPITRTPRDFMLGNLGSAITSCVDDAVIDRRMARLGFDPKALNHDAVKHFKQEPPPAPDDRFTIDGNALAMLCFAQRLKPRGDDVEATWKKISPEVVERSRALAKEIGDIRCDDAHSCTRLKKRIRDALGYPLRFCNPENGNYE